MDTDISLLMLAEAEESPLEKEVRLKAASDLYFKMLCEAYGHWTPLDVQIMPERHWQEIQAAMKRFRGE